MSCKRCDELTAAYENAVRRYTDAVKTLRGMVGEDFRLAMLAAEGLRVACKRADDEQVAHWHTHTDQSHPKSSS